MYSAVSDQQGFLSLFASSFISKHQTISPFRPKSILQKPTMHSVQISKENHIILDPEDLKATNHSCNPNAFFDIQTMNLVALKEIQKGQEITFFYPSTEWNISCKFICGCGYSECLGKIGGASQTPIEILKNYRLNKHIIGLLASQKSIIIGQ